MYSTSTWVNILFSKWMYFWTQSCFKIYFLQSFLVFYYILGTNYNFYGEVYIVTLGRYTTIPLWSRGIVVYLIKNISLTRISTGRRILSFSPSLLVYVPPYFSWKRERGGRKRRRAKKDVKNPHIHPYPVRETSNFYFEDKGFG